MSSNTGPTVLPEGVDEYKDMECSECGSSCKARCLAFHMNRFGCHKELCPLNKQPVNAIIDQGKFVARAADPAEKPQPKSTPVPPFAPEPPKFWEPKFTDRGAYAYTSRDNGRDRYREQPRRREPSRPPTRDEYRGRDKDSSDRERRRGPSRARDDKGKYSGRDKSRQRDEPRRRHNSRPPSPERQHRRSTRDRDSDRYRDAPKKTSYPPRAGGEQCRPDRARSQTRGAGVPPPPTNARPEPRRSRSRSPELRGTGAYYEDEFSPRVGSSRIAGRGPATFSSPSPFMQHGFAARSAGGGGGRRRDPFDHPPFQNQTDAFADPFFQWGPGPRPRMPPMRPMPPMPSFGSKYGTDINDMIDQHMADVDDMVEHMRSRFRM